MKTKLLLLSALFFAALVNYAQVALPHYEGFNYTVGETLINPGTNTGFGAWTIPSFQTAGSTPDPLIVASPNPAWSLPENFPAATGNAIEFVGGGDDPVLTIPNQGSTGVIYSSFVFRVTDQAAVTVNSPGYFYSFAKIATSGTSLNYTSCVYITKITDTTFNLGISENNNTTNAVFTTTPLNTNTDILVVISYDIDNAVSRMWINPVANGVQPTTTFVTNETATATRTDLTMVRLSLDSNSRIPTIVMDEIRIGNTWLDAVPSSLSVAETNINKVSIYPNPAKNNFQINADNAAVKNVAIFTLEGKQVLTVENTNQVNVSNLSAGLYLVKISGENAETIKKLVIK